jgi:probable phosphoglycerate mutase
MFSFATSQQGHCDYPLTELGETQAAQLGKALHTVDWDGIYSSDLTRAVNTLNILLSNGRSNSQSPQIIHTSELREINFGVREALPRGTTVAGAKAILSKRMGVSEDAIENTAEKHREVADRQMRFLKSIRKDIQAKEALLRSETAGIDDKRPPYKILCVTHGGFIKIFLRKHCKFTPPSKIDNCSQTIITMEYDASGDSEDFTLHVDESNVNTTFTDTLT